MSTSRSIQSSSESTPLGKLESAEVGCFDSATTGQDQISADDEGQKEDFLAHSPTETHKEDSSESTLVSEMRSAMFGFLKPLNKVGKESIPEQPQKVESIEADAFSHDPLQFLLRLKYKKGGKARSYCKKLDPVASGTPKPDGHTRFVCISDTHTKHRSIRLPKGDVLLHCGDFSFTGTRKEVEDFNTWLGEIPFEHKIVIAGNHELSFERTSNNENVSKRVHFFRRRLKKDDQQQNMSALLTNCTYLEDEEVAINGIRIWGSPWQPEFGGWAFNVNRGQEILDIWNKIPGDGIDILLTHGPPAGHGDCIVGGTSVGCVDLLNTVQLRVQPKYHLFGHIHEARGITTDHFTTYMNCSSVNYSYQPVHEPFIFDLPNK